MRISEHIVSFDEDYFQFLQDELKSLGKNIGEKFKEKIVINCFVFGLVDILLKKLCMGCYHSIFIAIYFFDKEVAKQLINVIFAPGLLLTSMTLEQELTGNLLSLKKALNNHLFSI